MLTGKERSYLKSLAHNMDPLIQLGKDGINQGFLNQIDKLLEDHEIGKKLTIYRESKENKKIEL